MIEKIDGATKNIIKILDRNSVYKNNRQGVRSLMLEVRMMEDAALEQLEIISEMIKDIQGQCQHKKVKMTEGYDDEPYCEYYYSITCNDCGLEVERLYEIDNEILRNYGLKL